MAYSQTRRSYHRVWHRVLFHLRSIQVTHYVIIVLDSSLGHYPYAQDNQRIPRFLALNPLAEIPTCHSKHADLCNFDAFFLVRSVGHVSARIMFRGFSQGYKALQAYSWSD